MYNNVNRLLPKVMWDGGQTVVQGNFQIIVIGVCYFSSVAIKPGTTPRPWKMRTTKICHSKNQKKIHSPVFVSVSILIECFGSFWSIMTIHWFTRECLCMEGRWLIVFHFLHNTIDGVFILWCLAVIRCFIICVCPV